MEYALLIYAREGDLPEEMSEAEQEAFYADFRAFNAALREAGAFRSAQRLKTIDTATTVRVEEGEVVHTDGPFAETKECLAGFFLIDVDDLDQALHWASRLPSARIGSVEVRPVLY